jgi:long-chain fatty acid transport protein
MFQKNSVCFWLGLLLALLGKPIQLNASPLDILGVNPRSIALGGAYTALADDPSAVYYNPAGLIRCRMTKMEFSYFYASGNLSAGYPQESALSDEVATLMVEQKKKLGIYSDEAGTYRNVDMVRLDSAGNNITVAKIESAFYAAETNGNVHGIKFGLALPMSEYTSFGILIYKPLYGIITKDTLQISDPYYLDYGNSAHSFLLRPGFALRLPVGLALGASLTFLSDADVDIDGYIPIGDASKVSDTNTKIKVGNRPKLNLGLLYQSPWHDLSLGFSFMSEIYSRTDVVGDLTVDIRTSDGLIQQKVVPVTMHMTDMYSPLQTTLGISARIIPKIIASADLNWARWSRYLPPFPHMTVDPVEDQEVPTLSFESPLILAIPDSHFKNTVTPKLGLEYQLLPKVALRSGYYYDPSPVPTQNGVTNILDGNTHSLALGFGWETIFPFTKTPMNLDVFGRCDYMPTKITVKSNLPTYAELRDIRVAYESGDYERAEALENELLKQGKIRDEYYPNNPTAEAVDTLPNDSQYYLDKTYLAYFDTTNAGYPAMKSGGTFLTVGLSLRMNY